MVVIDQEKCIGCGACAVDCCALNIHITDGKAKVKKACIECGHCVTVCPVSAVSIPEYDMEDVEEITEGQFELDPEKFLRAVKCRRSIRTYKPEKVESEKLLKLAEVGRYTATAKNMQSNGFAFIQEELETLKKYVWDYVEERKDEMDENGKLRLFPFTVFNERRKADPADDYLFRNAPVVCFITSERVLDAGLAAQNMEMMAISLGLGVLYNGFLARLADANIELKQWLGIQNETICACMLIGYPDVKYLRTAPRKKAQVIMK